MKQINIYINEKLRLSAKPQYTCQPINRRELQDIIIDRVKNEGNQCDLNDIDVSKITDMSYIFNVERYDIFKDFNGDISMWDVSNVTNMECMFYNCEKFNCDLSSWDVSNVTNMWGMFWHSKNFDCNISMWNVSNVKIMNSMFYGCEKFNQNLDSWDVSNVKTMDCAFEQCPTKPTWYDKDKWEIQ